MTREDAKALRHLVAAYGAACERFGSAREAMDTPGRNEAMQSMRAVAADIRRELDRLEEQLEAAA